MRHGLVALAVSLLGCGQASTDLVDSGPPPDAEPPPPVVTVDVVSGDQPASGIHVIFQRPDGTVEFATVSGQGGRTEYAATPGGMVTVVPPGAPISTFTDVQIGDTLTFDVTPRGRPDGVARITTAPNPNADSVTIATGCGARSGAPGEELEINITTACVSGDQMAAFAIALSAGAPIAVSKIRDQVVNESGATFTLPAWDTNIESYNLSIVDIASTVNPVFAVGEVINDVVYEGLFILAVDAGPPANADFLVNPSNVDAIQYAVSFGYGPRAIAGGTITPSHFDFFRRDPTEAASVYDTNMPGLPITTGMSLDLTDPIRPTIGISNAATTADAWVGTVAWNDGTTQQAWDVMGDPASPMIKLPELPDFLQERWAPSSSAAFVSSSVIADVSIRDGYGDLRNQEGFSAITSGRPPLGGPGSFVHASLAVFTPQ